MFSPSSVIFFALAAVDLVLDWLFLFTLGLVCKPCASLLIWIVNLIYLPFYVLAYIRKVWLETFGLVIDGWMMIFNFSGCYIMFGRHCWARRSNWLWTYYDIPFFKRLADRETGFLPGLKALATPPNLSDSASLVDHAIDIALRIPSND